MSTQELQITTFDPTSATEADWAPLHAYRDAIFHEANPDDPLPPHEIREQQIKMMSENPHFAGTLRIARDADGVMVGTLMFGFAKPESPDYEQQKITAFATLDVVENSRRQGVGKQLLREIVQACREHGDFVRLVQGTSETLAGHAFTEQYGGTVAMTAKENRLYADAIDWDMVRQWHEEAPKRVPDVTIETFVGVPEHDMEAYCAFFTEVVNQIPVGEMEGSESTFTPEVVHHRAKQAEGRGDVWVTMITREADGTISGLTETFYNPKRPYRATQELTGVREAYRGRGLGKWLKSAMLLYVQEHYHEIRFITTGNADSNAPMLSINDRLGFKPYKEIRAYKLELATAVETLGL